MHRQALLSLLEDYRRQNPTEADTVDQFSLFVQSNSNCFERSLLIGHVTGSAWLVSIDAMSVLLTHHKKLNRWLQLGGHADGDSNIPAVALREAQEESGLTGIQQVGLSIFDIDIHVIPERKNEPQHLHYDVRFALKATADQGYVVSDESHQLAWVPIAALGDQVQEASMLRMAAKWLARSV